MHLLFIYQDNGSVIRSLPRVHFLNELERNGHVISIFNPNYYPDVYQANEAMIKIAGQKPIDLMVCLHGDELVFADTVFNAYEQPRNTSPPNGAALMIVASHPTGISVLQTFPMEQLDDGALLLAASPSSELMGAPVFDSYNALAGIVAGSFDPRDGRGELLALVPSSLWYFWIETLLADAGMNTPEFGVTAMPATSGLSSVQGILILDVRTGSAAWESGLREGDIVTTINGEHVYHPEALKGMVLSTTEELTLHVQRDSEKVLVVIPSR